MKIYRDEKNGIQGIVLFIEMLNVSFFLSPQSCMKHEI